MKHGCDEPDKELGASYFFLGDQLSSLPFEPFKTMGKTLKSSVPVLSAAKPWFSQGFSHFWPIALAFCSAHAGTVYGGSRRCISRRAPQIESFFESRESPKHWGFACPL
jgi:hypothetical protein